MVIDIVYLSQDLSMIVGGVCKVFHDIGYSLRSLSALLLLFGTWYRTDSGYHHLSCCRHATSIISSEGQKVLDTLKIISI